MSTSRALMRLRPSRVAARQCLRLRNESYRQSRPLSTRTKPVPLDSKPRRSRIPWRYAWYLLFLGTGTAVGLTLRTFAVSRLDPPRPGSEEDQVALDALADQIDQLDIVKKMRTQVYDMHSGIPSNLPRKRKGGWMELDIASNVVESATEVNISTRTLTNRALAGIQGLGVQRAFWNSETRELVAVVWIGSRLSGWPGVAHGGAIATIFQDAMSRMIAGPNGSIDSVPTPASMSVTYARPTLSFNLFVLRASFSRPDLPQELPPSEPAPAKSWLPSWKDLTKKRTSAPPEPPMEISGTLESLDGEVKVRAKGTWPASAIIESNA